MAIKEKHLTRHHYDGETQPPPLYRRRSVQVGGSIVALAVAGGLYTILKPSHHGTENIKLSRPNPTAEATSSPSASPLGVQPTEKSAGTQAKALKPLCTTVPAEVFASVLSDASCSPTNRDDQSTLPFRTTDLADSEWGGPEGRADEVIVQIRPSIEYGYDQFKIQKQVNSSSRPEDVTVHGYAGIYIPEQDFTTDSGYQVRAEIAIVKAGPYLVTLVAEQLSPNESPLPEQNVTNLTGAIISHELPTRP